MRQTHPPDRFRRRRRRSALRRAGGEWRVRPRTRGRTRRTTGTTSFSPRRTSRPETRSSSTTAPRRQAVPGRTYAPAGSAGCGGGRRTGSRRRARWSTTATSTSFRSRRGHRHAFRFPRRGRPALLEEVVPSGGGFPASIAVHDGSSTCQRRRNGNPPGLPDRRHRLSRWQARRELGLANTDPPGFLTSPGQVGFTPDGKQLIVTTKLSGSLIQAVQGGRGGMLSATAGAQPVGDAGAVRVHVATTTSSPAARLRRAP